MKIPWLTICSVLPILLAMQTLSRGPSAATSAVDDSARAHVDDAYGVVVPEDSAGSRTGRLLGSAVLLYLAVTTLMVTWAPFNFASHPQHGVTSIWTWSDLILNVVMFVPLGLFCQSVVWREKRTPWWMVGVAGAAFSAGIEAGQLFLPDRFTSLFDVITNGVGAAIGARTYVALRPRISLGAGTVSVLALDLPLTGLVILLIPLLWASGFGSEGSSRVWLMLPVAAFGGGLLGAVHGAYLDHTGRVRRSLMLLASALWFVVAALPGASGQWDVLLAGATLAVGTAWLRSYSASRARMRDGAQRVELPTLRLVLPLFAVYLVLSALWPLDAVDGEWRAAFALSPARADLSRALLMRAIEYLAALTVVGYVTAELYGRSNAPWSGMVARVLLPAVTVVVLIEVARGWHTMQGASGALGLLGVGASLFGGWLYHLQRDHVRTLLGRRSAPRSTHDQR